ncbi:camp-binding domain-like protein [Clavulina sp. PMI_390]|nr:camp-binding domain-like protein [Clavulina sp. PMI_390]
MNGASSVSTFELLLADLTRDVNRAQPRDALQFCADWFNTRLREQRVRIRDIFDSSAVTNASTSTPPIPAAGARVVRGHSAPDNLFRDQRRVSQLAPSSSPAINGSLPPAVPPSHVVPAGPPAIGPLDDVPPNSALAPATAIPARRVSASSPFGFLNLPGNAALTNNGVVNGGGAHRSLKHARSFSAIKEEDDGDSPSAFNPRPHGLPSSAPLGTLSVPGLSPSALGRRTSVSGESLSPASGIAHPPPYFPKSPDQISRLEDAIHDAFLFQKLDNKRRKAVLGAMKEMQFSEGSVVIAQGDDGDFFYVVDSGTLDVFKRGEDEPAAVSPTQTATADWHPKFGKKVFSYERGGTFGELALMYYAKRAATVIATSQCTLWALDRVTFQTILLNINAATRRSYEEFLRSVPLLESLNDVERAKLADVLQPREYDNEDVVIKEGEKGREFFIVEEGEAEALKQMRNEKNELVDRMVKSYQRGDYFGELALLHQAPRAATIRAVVRPGQPKLKVAVLDADAFTRLLGPLRELMQRSANTMYSASR